MKILRLNILTEKTLQDIRDEERECQARYDADQMYKVEKEYIRRHELDAAEIKSLLADNHALRVQIGSKK